MIKVVVSSTARAEPGVRFSPHRALRMSWPLFSPVATVGLGSTGSKCVAAAADRGHRALAAPVNASDERGQRPAGLLLLPDSFFCILVLGSEMT
jgi:hypothetical protein